MYGKQMEKKKNVAVEYIRSTLVSVQTESRKSDHPKEQVCQIFYI